jgi:cyclohexanone monooxygenase
MVLCCEQHVEWISRLLAHAKEHGIDCIEADREAQSVWAREVTESAARTLYPKANSWYVGANVPGKPRVFMPYVDGFNVYSSICEKISSRGYEGFHLSEATKN